MVGIDFKQKRFLCFKNISAVYDALFVCNLSISRVDIVRFQVKPYQKNILKNLQNF